MRRLTLIWSVIALGLFITITPVAAGRGWCAKDPIVSLNGAHLQLWVAIPEEYVHLVNGPIAVEYRIPASVTREVVFLDDGFNGYGETVAFFDSDGNVNSGGLFDVEFMVHVPIDPVRAEGIIDPQRVPLHLALNEDGKRSRNITTVNDGRWFTTKVKSAR